VAQSYREATIFETPLQVSVTAAVEIDPWPPERAAREFLSRYHALRDELDAESDSQL
jgi:hypothetical protein